MKPVYATTILTPTEALSIFAHKLGRTVYFMLKRNQSFDPDRFLANA